MGQWRRKRRGTDPEAPVLFKLLETRVRVATIPDLLTEGDRFT
jgi:hypothetical protein